MAVVEIFQSGKGCIMPKDVRDWVVVITGASSGIGRATAREFARRGASLVLAARGEEALRGAVAECEEFGGRAIAVPMDVSDAGAVRALADRAIQTYGSIDVWVNNAAVSLFGRIEETPTEDFEQVLRINIFGYVNGCREAIRQFREQGHGRLINVSSMVGHVGQPYTSAYVTSKWAIRGLSECLRMELMDAPGITCSTILPASIDTPIFQHAGNYTGREVKAMTPVYAPEQVAAAIVACAERPRREVFVGNAGRAMAALRTLAPSLGERMMARQVENDHLRHDRFAPGHAGNLYRPRHPRGGRVRGGWIVREHPPSSERRSAAGLALGVAALALPLALYAATRSRKR